MNNVTTTEVSATTTETAHKEPQRSHGTSNGRRNSNANFISRFHRNPRKYMGMRRPSVG